MPRLLWPCIGAVVLDGVLPGGRLRRGDARVRVHRRVAGAFDAERGHRQRVLQILPPVLLPPPSAVLQLIASLGRKNWRTNKGGEHKTRL